MGSPLTADIYYNTKIKTTVNIHDGNDCNFSWKENGFQIVPHKTNFSDWDNVDNYNQYYHEMIDLVREQTDAKLIMASTVVRRSPEWQSKNPLWGPLQLVHSDHGSGFKDYVFEYRKTRPEPDAYYGSGWEDIYKWCNRVVCFQIWRNLGPTHVSYPIAFCDSKSIDKSQIFETVVDVQQSDERTHPLTLSRLKPIGSKHKWYWWDNLTDDKVILFRTYDSDIENYRAFHTAFEHPEPGRADRSSVDLRVYCFYE